MRTYKKSLLVCKILVLVLVGLLVFTMTPPGQFVFSLAFEDVAVKRELKNPYIDSYYRGWQKVTPWNNFGSIYLPGDWLVQDTGRITQISKADGTLIACAVYYEQYDEKDEAIQKVYQETLGFVPQSLSARTERWGYLEKGVAYTETAVGPMGERENLYQLSLGNFSPCVWICFVPDGIPVEELDSITAAIAFAYTYK